MLQRLERSDLAESRSRQAIDQFRMTSAVPPRIAGLLRDHWQRVLRQVWIESGEDDPDWLAFRQADDQALCGRVGHISKATRKLLLANPDWDFGVVPHPAIAESQFKDGRASISSRGSLFNAVAEQAQRRRSGSAQVPQG